MNIKNRIFWQTYIYLFTLVLMRFIPIINPGARTWGFNHLIFLPDVYTYGFFAATLGALMIPFIGSTEKYGTAIADWFSDKFLDGQRRYLYRILFIALMVTLFILFTIPTHFLGDGYRVIENLSHESKTVYKWTEIGAIILFGGLQNLFGAANNETTRLTFQVVSIISGAITIYFFFLISALASQNYIKRILIFMTLFLSGLLLLFFGYAEYYPIVSVFMSGFIFFSIKYLKSGRGLIFAWLFFLFGMGLHIQMAIFIPAVLFLTFSTGKGLDLYRRYKKPILSATGLIVVFCISYFIYKFKTDLYVEDMFLPLFNGKPVDPEYAIFSLPHLLDIFNEFILLSPLLFLLIIININKIKNIFANKLLPFLILVSAGSLLFLFVLDPKLAMSRDWDLFSMSALTLNILMILNINNKYITSFSRLIPSLIILLSFFAVPYLMTNIRKESSEKYMEYIIDLDFEKSLPSFSILNDYYKSEGYKTKIESMSSMYRKRYYHDQQKARAIGALVAGDTKTISALIPALKRDKFDAEYQRIMAMYYQFNKQYNKALEYISRAIQLRRYSKVYYQTRANIYLSQRNFKMAIKDAHEVIKLDSEYINALDGLSYIYYQLKQYDSCIYYAHMTLAVDSGWQQSYFWLSKSYALSGNIDSAAKYLEEYARFVGDDSLLAKNLELLENAIVESINK